MSDVQRAKSDSQEPCGGTGENRYECWCVDCRDSLAPTACTCGGNCHELARSLQTKIDRLTAAARQVIEGSDLQDPEVRAVHEALEGRAT